MENFFRGKSVLEASFLQQTLSHQNLVSMERSPKNVVANISMLEMLIKSQEESNG